jgi:hypothetical protein
MEADRWRVDVMAEPGDGDTWVYRRDPSLRAPRASMVGLSADGIPHLRAHGTLFFKAKAPRLKDRRDFDAAVATLDAPALQVADHAQAARTLWDYSSRRGC